MLRPSDGTRLYPDYLVLEENNADKASRWDDDVVFRNQARGTENKGNKEFVNVRIVPRVNLNYF